MKSSHKLQFALAAYGIGAAIIGFGIAVTVLRHEPSTAPSSKLHDYCSSVSVALAMDADDLANGTDKRKLAAAERFGEQVTFHSKYEISLCAKRPVDLEQQSVCAIGPDYDCLAKLAREAHDAVKP